MKAENISYKHCQKINTAVSATISTISPKTAISFNMLCFFSKESSSSSSITSVIHFHSLMIYNISLRLALIYSQLEIFFCAGCMHTFFCLPVIYSRWCSPFARVACVLPSVCLRYTASGSEICMILLRNSKSHKTSSSLQG